MSKQDKVQLPEDGSVQAAIKKIHDNGPSAYLVIGYGNPTTLAVIAEGEGGLAEAAAHFPDDDNRYAIVRKEHKVEMAKTVKFAYIDWTPHGMKPFRKATVSTHKGQVQAMLKPFHVDYSASEQSDLNDDTILRKIGFSSGTASHVTDKAATAKSTVQAATPWNRGASSGRVSVSGDEKKSSFTAVSKAGSAVAIKFADEDAFKAAIKSVRNDKENNWILASYTSKDTLSLVGTGSGGLDELLEKVEEEIPSFGLVRVEETIDKSKTTKFAYIYWIPESVKPMKKAEVGTKKGSIDQIFLPYHVDFTISTKTDITHDAIVDKVAAASGTKSHVVAK